MKITWDEAWQKSERKHQDLQDRILREPGSQRTLEKLAKAGADKKRILSLLASAVFDRHFWIPPVRLKKKQLESLANQLDTVANHAQRMALDPASYGPFWLALMGSGKWQDLKTPTALVPNSLFVSMRRYSEYCRAKAKAMGDMMRKARWQQREMTDYLLIEVWLRTRKHYDKEMALLLTNSFEASGLKRVFTEDQIKKHRQRYVMPRIKEYLVSHPAPPITGGTIPTP